MRGRGRACRRVCVCAGLNVPSIGESVVGTSERVSQLREYINVKNEESGRNTDLQGVHMSLL